MSNGLGQGPLSVMQSWCCSLVSAFVQCTSMLEEKASGNLRQTIGCSEMEGSHFRIAKNDWNPGFAQCDPDAAEIQYVQ